MQRKPTPGKRSRRNSAHRRRLSKAIFAKSQYSCVYCGATKCKLTVDHLFPLGRGGLDVRGNMVAACVNCNNSKGDMTILEWIDSGTAPKTLAVYINKHLYGG